MQIILDKRSKIAPGFKHLQDCDVELEYFYSSATLRTTSPFIFQNRIDFFKNVLVLFVFYLCLHLLEDNFQELLWYEDFLFISNYSCS